VGSMVSGDLPPRFQVLSHVYAISDSYEVVVISR
jgi:hypothetical protein